MKRRRGGGQLETVEATHREESLALQAGNGRRLACGIGRLGVLPLPVHACPVASSITQTEKCARTQDS